VPEDNDQCIACRLHKGELSAPGGTIYRDHLWVLEHCIEPIPLAGWLVLKPIRHVESFADLTAEEASSFGPLTHRITKAMTEVIEPAKIYLSMYMEGANAAHLHVHLIPRRKETPMDRRGPWIFEYLRKRGASEENQSDIALAVEIALRIRMLLSQR
jgi:diadenosine tetraphosphate (Ap4A) HIT family hydrolase